LSRAGTIDEACSPVVEIAIESPDERAHRSRGVTCPTCGTRHPWNGNPHRPFCSLTCRLIDLGRWLDERYRIDATTPSSDHDGDAR
jgi:uncharacterized protein